MSRLVGPGMPRSVGCIACSRVATLTRPPPGRARARTPLRRPSHIQATQRREHQREAEGQVLDRRVEDPAVAEEGHPLVADDRVRVVLHDAATGEPAVGEQLEEDDDRVRRPPGPGGGEPGAGDPAVERDRHQHAGDREGGVGHDTLRSSERAAAARTPPRRPTARTASKVSTDTSGMTTKKAISSSGSPAIRGGRVCPASNHQCPAVGGVEVPDDERRAGQQDRQHQPAPLAQHVQAEGRDERERPGEAEHEHRDVRPVRQAHPLTGRADRSPVRRLSTSSALIRHIGSPTPGTVLAPA